MPDFLPYNDEWGNTKPAGTTDHCEYCGSPVDRHGDSTQIDPHEAALDDIKHEIRRDVFGHLMECMNRDPLAFFVWTQRVMYGYTYERISERIASLNPRKVKRQAIYGRVRKMIDESKGGVPVSLAMPRARPSTIKIKLSTFDRMIERNGLRGLPGSSVLQPTTTTTQTMRKEIST